MFNNFIIHNIYPQLPEELKDKITFVNDMSELKDGMDMEELYLQDSLKLKSDLLKSEPYLFEGTYEIPYAYDDGIGIKKYRGQSNKKYSKRKKAKNGRTKKRRK